MHGRGLIVQDRLIYTCLERREAVPVNSVDTRQELARQMERREADPDSLDFLLEVSRCARERIEKKRYDSLCGLIKASAQNGYHEALSWILSILREEHGKEESTFRPFSCSLGRSILDYDRLMRALKAGRRAESNTVEYVYDDNGEVRAFFNIRTFATGFEGTYLVTRENFDNRDNDFIRYSLLLCAGAPEDGHDTGKEKTE